MVKISHKVKKHKEFCYILVKLLQNEQKNVKLIKNEPIKNLVSNLKNFLKEFQKAAEKYERKEDTFLQMLNSLREQKF